MNATEVQFETFVPHFPKGESLASMQVPFSLPGNIRRQLEQVFAVDFSEVVLHHSHLPVFYGAKAFARGHEIYIRPGYYAPDTPAGISLLGHELAHVIQQAQGRVIAKSDSEDEGARVLDFELEAEADEAAVCCVQRLFGSVVGKRAEMPQKLLSGCLVRDEKSSGPKPIQCVPITAAASYATYKTNCWNYLHAHDGTAIGALDHQLHMSELYTLYADYNGHGIGVPAKAAMAPVPAAWEMINILEATFEAPGPGAAAPFVPAPPIPVPPPVPGYASAVPNHDNEIAIQYGDWPQANDNAGKNMLLEHYYSLITGVPVAPPLLPIAVEMAEEALGTYIHIYPNPRRHGASNWRIGINVPPNEMAEAVRRLVPIMQGNNNIDHIKVSGPQEVAKPDSVIIYMRGATLVKADEVEAYIGANAALLARESAVLRRPPTPAEAAVLGPATVAPAAAAAAAILANGGQALNQAQAVALVAGNPANIDGAIASVAARGALLTLAEATAIVAAGGGAATAAAAARVVADTGAAQLAYNATLAAVRAAVTPVAAVPPVPGAPLPLNVVQQLGPMWEEYADGAGECAEPPGGGVSFGTYRSILAYQAYLLMRKQFCGIRWNAGNYGNTVDALFTHFGIPAPGSPQRQNRLADPFFTVRGAIFTGLKAISEEGTLLINN